MRLGRHREETSDAVADTGLDELSSAATAMEQQWLDVISGLDQFSEGLDRTVRRVRRMADEAARQAEEHRDERHD